MSGKAVLAVWVLSAALALTALAEQGVEELRRAWPPDRATGLSAIPGCEWAGADWADGDSFPVRLPGGGELTVRLYGVDCIELHVNDEADARRLRAQRQYFGLAGRSVEESVRLAKGFAAEAAATTAALLKRPFTVHTAFSDARGDGRFHRVYAFVTASDGRDLGATLVERGLARAFGVSRRTPWGESREDYAARLADLELAAAKRGAGAWAGTDWTRLVELRRQLREEENDLRVSAGRRPGGGRPINLNTAARDELMSAPGVGEALANRIIEGRPYGSVDELVRVKGISPATLERLREFFTVSE